MDNKSFEYRDINDGSIKHVSWVDYTPEEIHSQAANAGAVGSESYMAVVRNLATQQAEGRAKQNVVSASATDEHGHTLGNPESSALQSTIDQGTNAIAMAVAVAAGQADSSAANSFNQNQGNIQGATHNTWWGANVTNVSADAAGGGGGGGGDNNPNVSPSPTPSGNIPVDVNAPTPFGVTNPNVYGQAFQQAVGAIPDYNIFQRFLATQPYAFDPYVQSAASQQYQPLQMAFNLQRGYGSDVQAVQNALAGQGAYEGMDMANILAAIGQGGLNQEFGNPFAQFLSGTPDMSLGNLRGLVGGATTALNLSPDQLATGFINDPMEASRQAVLQQQLRTDPAMQARVVGLPIMQQLAPQARGAAENILSNIYNRYMAANPMGNFLNYAQGINLGNAFGA